MSTFFQWLIDLIRDARFWFVVEPWEKAVRVRMGKDAHVVGPGVHFKWPILDEVYIINTRLRLADAASQTLLLGDGKIATVSVQLGFSIHDPLQALSTYQKPEFSLSVLVHNCVADYMLSLESTDDISTDEMEEFVVAGLKDLAPNDGITVEFIKVTNLIISSPARTIRLVNDDLYTSWSSDPDERAKYQANVMQW